MTHKTKGIVLRAIKYGETSLVVTAFTELFGVQTYMVNGVRTSNKSGSKAAMFQPAAILDMEVYHNDQRPMQRIKECNWSFLYQGVLSDVVKNSIALFIVELLQKSLKQPEENNALFEFCEHALHELDAADNAVSANFSLYFVLHLSHFFGFRISDSTPEQDADVDVFLDLQEGLFTTLQPQHTDYLQGQDAHLTADLLKIMQPVELVQIRMHHLKRRSLLSRYLEYYALHIPDFGHMKTLKVMQEILS